MGNGEIRRVENAFRLMNSGLSDQELIQRTGMTAVEISARYAQAQAEKRNQQKRR